MNENYKVYSISVPGKGQVKTCPDLPINLAGVTDIKHVKNISFTEQLQAQATLAKQQGTSFNLIISPNTETISKPLSNAIKESKAGGGKIFEYNSQTQKMVERFVEGNKVIR